MAGEVKVVRITNWYLAGVRPEELRRTIRRVLWEKYKGKSFWVDESGYSVKATNNTVSKLSAFAYAGQPIEEYRLRAEVAWYLEELLENVVEIEFEANRKIELHPDVERIMRAYTFANIEGKIYLIVMVIRCYRNGNMVVHHLEIR